MIGSGATHRGAPFVGRSREIALLGQLLGEGLRGSLRLVYVAGAEGAGRRRLMGEAMHREPDAEWVDLAPGGVEADIPRWARTELPDLLATYPEPAYPSFALHTLARYHPALRGWASRPALSREALPAGAEPEAIGSAVGAILLALTARTTVIVHAGLWPAEGSDRERALLAAARIFAAPGVVMTAALDPDRASSPEPWGTRVLMVPPLAPMEIRDLIHAWDPTHPPGAFAAWLHRATGGRPFFLHETVRWLEELGHVRVDEEARTVIRLAPVEKLPIPLGLAAVLENRAARLKPAARYLMSLVSDHDGRMELEELRAIYEADETTFDEALAALRRREYLLYRTARRPVALAGLAWRPLAISPSRRRLKRRRTPAVEPLRPPARPESPLAQAARRLDVVEALLRTVPDSRPLAELARIAWTARLRRGAAWDGVCGRVALFAGVVRRREGELDKALGWTRTARARLARDTHPGLRRSLGELALRVLEEQRRSEEAAALRASLHDEACFAGHDLAAAAAGAATAEGFRRIGRLHDAERRADAAEQQASVQGIAETAERAWITRVRALVDLRRFGDAVEIARSGPRSDESAPPTFRAAAALLEAAREEPDPAAWLQDNPERLTISWSSFGLDDNRLQHRADAVIQAATEILARNTGDLGDWGHLASLEGALADAGLRTAAADVCEIHARAAAANEAPESWAAAAGRLVEWTARLAAPERTGALPERLAGLPAAHAAALRLLLGPHLFRPESERPAERPPGARFHATGRPRLVRGARVWPRPLWPAWWIDLIAAAMASDLLREPFPAETARALLDASGDAPAADLGDTVHAANDLLWNRSALPGGVHLRGRGVAWDWSGIGCDLREIVAALDAGDARAALDALDGPILPALRGEAVARLRAELGKRVTAVASAVPFAATMTGSDYARWGDRAGRAVPEVLPLLASALNANRWTRAARHLGRASRLRDDAPSASNASP